MSVGIACFGESELKRAFGMTIPKSQEGFLGQFDLVRSRHGRVVLLEARLG